VFTGSLFAGVIPGIIREYRTLGRPEDLEDESIGSFLERRLGSTQIGDNLISAAMHGIYAGDIYQLSAKSLMPSPWFTELEFGGMIRGGLKHASEKTYAITERDYALSQEMRNVLLELARSDEMRSANIYSFKRGIGTLSDALATALKKNSRVQIKTGSTVKKVSLDSEGNCVKVSYRNLCSCSLH
jgi:protoporphyrinogen/coproporphyrinogen III oxidase